MVRNGTTLADVMKSFVNYAGALSLQCRVFSVEARIKYTVEGTMYSGYDLKPCHAYLLCAVCETFVEE